MRRTTREHDLIQTWAEARGARPARVRGSAVLRLAFDRLPPNWEAISWEQFFEMFEQGGLELWYEDAAGSRICKLSKGVQAGRLRPG